jgi:hypothetical protein
MTSDMRAPDMRGGTFPTAPVLQRIEPYQIPQPIHPEMPVSPQIPGMGGMGYNPTPPWGDPDRTWDATPWGPRLPKELVETKQSIDSLRKEIVDLKETIKALETQIQLLTRNILLERTKEKDGTNWKRATESRPYD